MSSPRRSTFQTVAARLRLPLLGVGLVAVVTHNWRGGPLLYWGGLAVLVLGAACYLRLGVHRGDPVVLQPPVRRRWIAVNSPADRVPSHHVTAYGQGQAVDLVHDPGDGTRPRFGRWPLARRPEEFPGFGQPVFSPADGTVLRVVRRRRDHWSRTSVPALLYLLLEGVRELLGPSQILGNHVIIDCGHRRFAVLAHLRRDSVLVRPGQSVSAGQRIAECGNSGNSTEPHLHVQLMDHPSPLFAAGLPIVFDLPETGARMPAAGGTLLGERQ